MTISLICSIRVHTNKTTGYFPGMTHFNNIDVFRHGAVHMVPPIRLHHQTTSCATLYHQFATLYHQLQHCAINLQHCTISCNIVPSVATLYHQFATLYHQFGTLYHQLQHFTINLKHCTISCNIVSDQGNRRT